MFKFWIILACMLLVCSSCTTSNESEFSSLPASQKEESLVLPPSMEPSTKNSTNIYDEISDDFLDGYQFAVYKKYNSPAEDNGLGNTPIYFFGILTEISLLSINSDTLGNAYFGTVETSEGSWAVVLDYENISPNGDYSAYIDSPVIICGIYQGFSGTEQMPCVMMKKMYSSNHGEMTSGISILYQIAGDEISTTSSSPEPEVSTAPDTVSIADVPREHVFSQSGSGDSIIQSVEISAPSCATFKTSDTHHHAVKAYYGDGDYDYDLLVNDSGAEYNGTAYLLVDRTYDFEIDCSGEWELEIYTIGYSTQTGFSGHGDSVTDIIQPAGKYYNITYTGTDHFSVKQRYGTGEYDYELLVNESGEPYSGTVRLANSDKMCFFEISGTDGDWTITPAE